MNTKKLTLFAILLGASGLAVASTPSGVWNSSAAGTSDAIAQALRSASFQEAEADYWVTVARCANDGDQIARCLFEAGEERDEAIEEANDQFDERIKVNRILGQAAYLPDIDPNDFSTTVNSTYLPFTPGRTMIYELTNAKGTERIEVKTLSTTLEIEGVECIEVLDIAMLNGEVIEETIDWYAQHTNGDVWYFGEIAKNFDEDGFLEDIDGSWRYGVDGAQPGIVGMQNPSLGLVYRQEYLIAEAEDMAKIVSVNETVIVPAGTFTNCLKTLDGSPIEPGVIEEKFFAPGIGLVLEVDPETGDRLELIQIL